jgi:hypothetical protein
MLVSEWPKGIDVIGPFHRWLAHRCAPRLRATIEKLAVESSDLRGYDMAAESFLKTYQISAPVYPGRAALQRLARRYVRHFRAELVRLRQYIEMASRRALLGAA